jgi:SAM-dependent methyltransferase
VHHPVFARFYARISVASEPMIGPHRDELLAGLSGRVIEIGAGNGLNFAHYPSTVSEVVAIEPERSLRQLALTAALRSDVPVDVVPGVAEALPVKSEAFDGAVVSLVLCSVRDLPRALAEIRRVLRPGGLYQGTMLSKRNGNFGAGREVAPDTFVIDGIDDKSHPHFYCDAAGIVARFHGFTLLSLADRPHARPGSWHWHLLAERV